MTILQRRYKDGGNWLDISDSRILMLDELRFSDPKYISFNEIDIKINGQVFFQYSKEFLEALNKAVMWMRLKK